MFRFVMDHLQDGPTLVMYKPRINIKLNKHTETFVLWNFSTVFL